MSFPPNSFPDENREAEPTSARNAKGSFPRLTAGRGPVRNLLDGSDLTGRFRYRPMMRADARWTGRACEA
jgi:hypothetical protein